MKQFLLIGAMVLSFGAAQAQGWLWGKRGGSETKFGNGQWETVWDITADKNGNTYALCRVDGPGRDIDDHLLGGFGDYDIIITSFDCAGNYRWSKVIGSNDHQDVGVSIKTDDDGNVYACGELYMPSDLYTGHIDNDSTLVNTRRSLFIVKYSSAGAFQWLQMPQPDTVSAEMMNRNKIFDMAVEPNGNIHVLAMLSGGNYNNGYGVNGLSMHLMHYNYQGSFINATPFEMSMKQLPGNRPKMAYDANSQRYYLAGMRPNAADSVRIDGDSIAGNCYVAAFNSAGEHVWTVEGSVPGGGSGQGTSGFDGRPVVDDEGNIYVAGRTFHNDVFQGTTVTNSVTVLPNLIPMVVKLTPDGDVAWMKYAPAYEGRGIAVSLKDNNELYLAGYYDGKLRWDGYTAMQPTHVLTQEEDIFLATMNRSTGAVVRLDTIGSDYGTHDYVTCITTDVYGNAVIGGRFEGEVYVGAADTLVMEGETSDLFIAKYGGNICWTSSVQSTVNSEQITVWPNPASTVVTISSAERISSVSVVDVTGRVVLQRTVNSEQVTVDVSGLSSGVYFVAIVSGGNKQVKKVIIK